MNDELLWDSVFGSCLLTPLCAAFLHTPEHERLKHVAMNHADILYASVLYSRREHCIAVMALARRWSMKLTLNARLADLIALAGLYHDVGHVALSHTMDHFLQLHEGISDHEIRSTLVVRRVNKRLGGLLSKAEEDFVCDAISGCVRADSVYPTWAYHIVHQPDRTLPDVDRIVYLCHDSYKLGVTCTIDVPRITNCLYIRDNTLCFASECEVELNYIIELRTRLFAQVFQHPTVCAYQTSLLTKFCLLYTKERLLALFHNDFAWLELTDVLLWSVIHQI
jgi:HD superfamily phosphohydrolase